MFEIPPKSLNILEIHLKFNTLVTHPKLNMLARLLNLVPTAHDLHLALGPQSTWQPSRYALKVPERVVGVVHLPI